MSLKLPKSRKPLWAALFLSLTLVFGISIGYFFNHVFSENARFENFTRKIFENELAGSALTFHYSIAHPEKAGLKRPKASLGTVDMDTRKKHKLCRGYEKTLKNFDPSRLSRENQITLDTLLLYFHTECSLGENALLEEMLGPSLGIQAQLPVLLAEYAFYENQDITDYLNLLSSIGPYFDSIIDFERKKSDAGYFMSDATLDRICRQCSAFIKNPESNYLLEIFSQKLSDYGKFSEEEQKKLTALHKKILIQQVIPAYKRLIDGLNSLRGTGKNDQGLAHFAGGQEYYLYLLKSQVGTYLPVSQIERRLSAQLAADIKKIGLMLKEQPSLLTKLSRSRIFPSMAPDAMMEVLQNAVTKDFPELSDVSYEIRYVHKSLEEYLSPAFYLTPPMDTGTPNVIYINNSGRGTPLDLFATLAHEGFPGHLYQTVFFSRKNPAPIRCLIDCEGFVEGWATYVETFAYDYAASLMDDEAARDVSTLAWLNRSVNLCICSLLDIGIHYRGWSLTQASAFLGNFGIREKAVQEIYQYIVETPSNYLKYYWGYLNFIDLRASEAKRQGDVFDVREFHRKVLDMGAVPFPVLEKYIR